MIRFSCVREKCLLGENDSIMPRFPRSDKQAEAAESGKSPGYGSGGLRFFIRQGTAKEFQRGRRKL